MFLKFKSELKASEWIDHNNAIVGYDSESEAKTRTLAKAIEGADGGFYISLSRERWDGENLAEPLELLEAVIVEDLRG